MKLEYRNKFSDTDPYPHGAWFHTEIEGRSTRHKLHTHWSRQVPRLGTLFRESLGIQPRTTGRHSEASESDYVRSTQISVSTIWDDFPPVEDYLDQPWYKLMWKMQNNHWVVMTSVTDQIEWINRGEELGCIVSLRHKGSQFVEWKYKDPILDVNGIEPERGRKPHTKANYQEIKEMVLTGASAIEIVRHFYEMHSATVRYNIIKANKEIKRNGETSTSNTIRIL